MKKDLIKKKYYEKVELINRYNKKYYDENISEISDDAYDYLKREILNLEIEYSFLKHKKSPSSSVGFKPSKNFKKVNHKVPMLSLSNAFDEDDLKNFEKKILNYLDFKEEFNIEYSAEPKIDGISASLIYKSGKFITGLSRGDGNQGENITANLKTIKDIPHKITDSNFPDEIDIRGEIYIQNSDFEKLKTKFANPRNAASGSLRQKNPEETKKIPLKFIAYTFGYERGLEVSLQSEYLKKLKFWGFKTNPLNKTIKNLKNLMKNYNEIEKKRGDLDLIEQDLIEQENESNED